MAENSGVSMVAGHGAWGSNVLRDQRNRHLPRSSQGRFLLEALSPRLPSLLDMPLVDALEPSRGNGSKCVPPASAGVSPLRSGR